MKTLLKFFTTYPSFTKCSSERVSKKTGLKLDTVVKFKKSLEYKSLRSNYYSSLTKTL